MTHHFLITSYGRTATMWLSKLIAKKSRTIVVHGAYPVAITTPEEALPPAAERHAFLQKLATISLKQYFDLLATRYPQAQTYGNIHGFIACDAERRLSEPDCPFSEFINLTRNPITRIESLYSRWRQEFSWSPSYHIEQNQQVERSTLGRNVFTEVRTKTTEDRQFVLAFIRAIAVTLSNDSVELELKHAHHFRMEDITAKPESLAKLFSWIFPHAATAQLFPKAIASIKSRPVNASALTGRTPKSTWDNWARWQRYAFRIVAEYFEPPYRTYQKLGYDVHFAK
jgi:hypothetical protein